MLRPAAVAAGALGAALLIQVSLAQAADDAAVRECAARVSEAARVDCIRALLDGGSPSPAAGTERGALSPPGPDPGRDGGVATDGSRAPAGGQPDGPAADRTAESGPVESLSALTQRWQLDPRTESEPFAIVPYKPTYVLPVSHNFRPGNGGDQVDDTEIEFQISFKSRVWGNLLGSRGDLWFGYTQKSFWQAYRASSPFRETNYEPELIYSYRTRFSFLGLNARLLTVGLNHQSNGRQGDDSRSWNRITAGALFDGGPLTLRARAWWRVPESDAEDDNPGIVDYVGRGEVRGIYRAGEQTLAVTVRSNFDPDDVRGAVQVDYSFPLNRPVKGYIQLFHGYGDSLIDYRHVSSRVGIGLMLIDWL